MEHIVQFGISIDDDQIKKTIENNVRSQVVAEIKKDCMKQLIGNDNVSAYQYSQKIKDMVNDNICLLYTSGIGRLLGMENMIKITINFRGWDFGRKIQFGSI